MVARHLRDATLANEPDDISNSEAQVNEHLKLLEGYITELRDIHALKDETSLNNYISAVQVWGGEAPDILAEAR